MTISYNLVTNVSAWFFWNTNFVNFSVIHVSQGSVATYVRCGGMSTQRYIANFMLSLSMQEFLKSGKDLTKLLPKVWWLPFLEHSVYTPSQKNCAKLFSPELCQISSEKIFGIKTAKMISLYEMHPFSTSPNLC